MSIIPKLDEGRRGRVVRNALVVHRVLLVDRAHDLTVDGPSKSVGLPVDSVIMVRIEGRVDGALGSTDRHVG